MFNPPHPGLTLRDDVLPALGLSVSEAAEQLGVSRVALSRVVNGRAAISPEMALRIEAWLGPKRGGDAHVWLAEQAAHDVWQARARLKASPVKVRRAPMAAWPHWACVYRAEALEGLRAEGGLRDDLGWDSHVG